MQSLRPTPISLYAIQSQLPTQLPKHITDPPQL